MDKSVPNSTLKKLFASVRISATPRFFLQESWCFSLATHHPKTIFRSHHIRIMRMRDIV